MSRIAIHHPQDPTRPTMIPEERYNPEIHDLWGEAEPSPDVEAMDDSLPDDFPARDQLIAAGLTTLHAVRGVADFDEIPDIGQTRERRIIAYLDDLEDE